VKSQVIVVNIVGLHRQQFQALLQTLAIVIQMVVEKGNMHQHCNI